MKTITLKIEARGDTRKEAIRQATKLILMITDSPNSIAYSMGDYDGNADAKWDEQPKD